MVDRPGKTMMLVYSLTFITDTGLLNTDVEQSCVTKFTDARGLCYKTFFGINCCRILTS
jgi:hypothetical protein